MAHPIVPHMVMADAQGNIFDDPDLLMVCRRGGEWGLPRPDELMPLPEESELFLLPGRRAVGLDPQSGDIVTGEEVAVAAFAAPAHTLSAHPAYEQDDDAPLLPPLAYGAVGFARDRLYLCPRQVAPAPRPHRARRPRRAGGPAPQPPCPPHHRQLRVSLRLPGGPQFCPGPL